MLKDNEDVASKSQRKLFEKQNYIPPKLEVMWKNKAKKFSRGEDGDQGRGP